MQNKIKLIEITSELGAGTRGASLGVGALKTASYNLNSSFFSDYSSVKVKDFNEFLFEANQTLSAIRIEHVEKEFSEIFSAVNEVFKNKEFPFILAGDHSTAAATIASIQESNPGKRVGAIWVDAHADLHSPYTSPSGNIHGMPLAIACGIDNKEQQVNEVLPVVEGYWKNLQSLSNESLQPKDIVFIGVRDTEAPEDFLIQKHGIRNFSVQEVTEYGGNDIAKKSLAMLEHCDLIYVSFDVDSMDPNEVSHGTGTPVPNGISVEDVTKLLRAFAKDEKLVCFETVEVNPTLDEKKNKMAETTLLIIEKVAKDIAQRD
ncbi:MAG: arginase [Flavobacteriales bacterium]